MNRQVITAAAARADRALATALGVSRAHADALLLSGAARVNGRRLKKGERLEAGTPIDVDGAADRPLVPEPDAPLRVLLERPDFVVLDKLPDQPSHPLLPGETGTLANALVARYPEVEAAGAAPREGGLCHRLDTETSGTLLAARTPQAFAALRDQFRDRSVRKVYLAWVRGTPPLDGGEGRIDLPLTGKGKTRVWRSDKDGRSVVALTTYRVFESRGEDCILEVVIETGVRHQIRAHLAAIGHPLIGDPLYAGGEPPTGHPHHLLHAWKLGFKDPETAEPVEVVAPVPWA